MSDVRDASGQYQGCSETSVVVLVNHTKDTVSFGNVHFQTCPRTGPTSYVSQATPVYNNIQIKGPLTFHFLIEPSQNKCGRSKELVKRTRIRAKNPASRDVVKFQLLTIMIFRSNCFPDR